MKTPSLLLAVLTVCAYCTVTSCADPERDTAENTPRKMVLVLSIDTLRADMLGSYGATGGHTPALDSLAAKGVVFRNAIAPMATTFPSHSSMFTGLYPRAHGVRWNGDTLAEEHVTLAEILNADGWNTGAFVSYKAMLSRGGLDQGFQKVSDEEHDPQAERVRTGKVVNELAFDFLDKTLEETPLKSTFLWLHYFEPHAPYPLTDYAEKALQDYHGTLADGADMDEFFALNKSENRSEETFSALRSLYEGRVRDADDLVKELLDGLKERGILDEMIILIVGDHGQLLGEHGRVGHGSILWQEVLEVPFIVVNPHAPHIGTEDARVGVVDLTPTILDMLGMDLLSGMQGRSLMPALEGIALTEQTYFSEVRIANPKQVRPKGQSDAVAVFSGQYKFVLNGDNETLWDLKEDHGESAPLMPTQFQSVVDQLIPLARFHKKMNPEALVDTPDMSEEMQQELEELGYIGDESG